jgi:Mrp family chromosome partitioning ATPase
MSSLDRAFFRAYAKEQPAAAVVDAVEKEADGGSPYIHFQSARRPQLRYRIEPTHTPWGQSMPNVPHAFVEPIAQPYEDDDYRLAEAPAPLVEAPSAWSSTTAAAIEIKPADPLPAEPFVATAPRQTIVEAPPTIEIAPPQARLPESMPAIERAADPFAGGIVCLPGVGVPESSYLATLLALTAAEIEIVAPAEAMAKIEPTAIPTVASQPEVASSEPTIALPMAEVVAASAVATNSVPIDVEPVERQPAVQELVSEPPLDSTSLLADAATACWEVDRYLYSTLSDRLLERYEYFSHAGDKLKQAAESGLKVLGITGVGREEGRSTLAVCLARAAAKSGLKVVLIDCDFQRPQLAEQIGLEVPNGWQSVAAGGLALPEVTIRSNEDGITLLPLTDSDVTRSLSLADSRAARVIAQARKTNDVVILDLGPLDTAAWHSGGKSPLDAAIVVWDRRRRKLDEAQAIARSLNGAGIEAVGIAENFAG